MTQSDAEGHNSSAGAGRTRVAVAPGVRGGGEGGCLHICDYYICEYCYSRISEHYICDHCCSVILSKNICRVESGRDFTGLLLV